jgi:hypothetical protein
MNNSTMVNYSHGKAFPKAIVNLGILFIITGVLLLINGNYFSLFIISVGVIFSCTYMGLQFDKQTNQYCEYVSFLVLKNRKWYNLDAFPFISILTKRLSSKQKSYLTFSTSFTDKFIYFDVCLLNHSHRKKIHIKRHDNLEDAKKTLNEVLSLLNVTSTKYNPVISEKTKRRKQLKTRSI